MASLPAHTRRLVAAARQAASDLVEHAWFALRRPRYLIRWLTGLSLAVSLGTLLLGVVLLRDLHHDAGLKAVQSSDNLVRALSRDIARNIQVYDLSLQGAQRAWADPRVHAMDGDLMRMITFDTSATAEYLGTMFIADAAGDVIMDRTGADQETMNMADRPYFLVHKQQPDAGLYVSRSFEGRLLHEPIIALTRRITNPDGSFGGIVEGAVRTAYFRDLFAQLDVGTKGSVALFRDDGYVIVRRPFRAEDTDRYIGDRTSFAQCRSGPHTHFVGTAALDQVRRIYTCHRVEGLPLILSIGLAVDDVFAEWRHKAVSLGVILVLLCAASVALSLSFRREIIRRRAVELDLVAAAKRLSQIAATDGLTGVPNRRSFEEALEREWRRATRHETSVAVLMLDVDHFKLYNDHYGHQMGDDVLRSVAECISGKMRRPGDTAARYGGEEFVALLADTELTGALNVAESIREAVTALAIPHAASPAGQITISIGVACIRPTLGERPSALIREADQALYDAKRAGRDQVMSGLSSMMAVLSIDALGFDQGGS